MIVRLLSKGGSKHEIGGPVFNKVLEWLGFLSNHEDEMHTVHRRRLLEAACNAFGLNEAQFILALQGRQVGKSEGRIVLPGQESEEQLTALLPKGGYLDTWRKYTLQVESPLSFLTAGALTALSCAIGRRVLLDFGLFKVYPNCSSLLIGPTGLVKKSTAIDVVKDFVREAALCPTGPDKATSEALVTSLLRSSQQFISASEFSVFFGKQKYNEGLVPMMLKLLDYPSEYEAETQSRGVEMISEPAVIILGGSTLSLLQSSTPEEVLSGGFLNRFMLVVEDDTPRSFSRPGAGLITDKHFILDTLRSLKTYQGPADLTPHAWEYYDQWYSRFKQVLRDRDEKVREIIQRTPQHILRVAMVNHFADHGFSAICDKCIQFGQQYMEYLIQKIPDVARSIDKTRSTSESEFVLAALKRMGGAGDHSTLLRRASARGINSARFKQVIKTLEESGQIKIDKRRNATFYIAEEKA